MMVDVGDATKCSYKNVIIRTVDNDVVVLTVVAFTMLRGSLEALGEVFGTGNKFRYIPYHEISRLLGPRKCQELMFSHIFAVCNNVRLSLGCKKKCVCHLDCYLEVRLSVLSISEGYNANRII